MAVMFDLYVIYGYLHFVIFVHYIVCTEVARAVESDVKTSAHWSILAHRIRISRIENLILPMLSYPGRQVTPSCEIAS